MIKFIIRNTFALSGLLVIVICALMTVVSVSFSPGTGSKIGQIVKLNREGMFRKTWEAELIRGGFSDGSGTVGTTPFYFTIESDEMAKSAKALMDSQAEVVVSYRMEGVYLHIRTRSLGVFATEIRRK